MSFFVLRLSNSEIVPADNFFKTLTKDFDGVKVEDRVVRNAFYA